MPLLLEQLLAHGLGLIGNAVMAKGQAVIEDKLGIKLENEIQTEEGRLKLLQAQHDNEQFLITAALDNRKQDLAEVQVGLADVASARAMQVAALTQSDLLSKQFIYYFSGAWSIFAMLYLASITFFTIPESSVRFADTITGFLLGTVIALILQYFLGTNAQSRIKDSTINVMAAKP